MKLFISFNCLLGLLFTACQMRTPTHNVAAPHVQSMEAAVDVSAVHLYVTKHKQWRQRDYTVRRLREESKYVIFEVHYLPDDRMQYPGGGESFNAYVDALRHKVVREVGFQ